MSAEHIYFEVMKLMNVTTQVDLLKKQQDQSVELIECDEHHLVFELLEGTCRMGQLVEADSVLYFKGQQKNFTAFGKIARVSPLGQSRIKVSIEMHNFDQHLWGQFFQGMRQEQTNLDQLFRSLKGEE